MQLLQPSPAFMFPSSHCSVPSTSLLPHVGLQSLSSFAPTLGGQQPSPFAARVIGAWVHTRLQLFGLPVPVSVVQACPSLQFIAHGMGVLASQVSPGSSREFPQLAEQSRSLDEEQVEGQQPSPLLQRVIGIGSHRSVQASALPVMRSGKHGLVGAQALHELGGSHDSPVSTTPLPHFGVQSLSDVSLPPSGQQPSAAPAIVIGIGVHSAVHALPVTVWGAQLVVRGHVVGHAPGCPAAIFVSHFSSPVFLPSPQTAPHCSSLLSGGQHS
jgi:hypothetical protein